MALGNKEIGWPRNRFGLMRLLFLLLAARSGAGVVGSELLQRCEWPRGVVLGLSRERGMVSSRSKEQP